MIPEPATPGGARSPERTRNEIDRIVALIRARAVIRIYRDGGYSWEEIMKKAPRSANPLGLSSRQLMRIYEGDDAYEFDKICRVCLTHNKPDA